ncbi:Sphingosine 1-Phosphate Receptor 3 [Manis pentadactyla]|nr:Sphingosine 1-Phosphate Receptor 3 [Manis pentadactyla]
MSTVHTPGSGGPLAQALCRTVVVLLLLSSHCSLALLLCSVPSTLHLQGEKKKMRVGVDFLLSYPCESALSSMFLIAIWKNSKFHNRMYFFIGNLALSDLLASIAYKVNILMSGKRTLSLSPTVWFLREGSMFMALGASTCS